MYHYPTSDDMKARCEDHGKASIHPANTCIALIVITDCLLAPLHQIKQKHFGMVMRRVGRWKLPIAEGGRSVGVTLDGCGKKSSPIDRMSLDSKMPPKT